MDLIIPEVASFKLRALNWASQFNVCCYLDSNNYPDTYHKFDTLIAAGAKQELMASTSAFNDIDAFRQNKANWLFGFYSYELKNQIEPLISVNPDHLHFPEIHFFQPEHLLLINGNNVTIISSNPQQVIADIQSMPYPASFNPPHVKIQARFTREAYIQTVEQIRAHIVRGDVYVTNFCQEFYAEAAELNPVSTFLRLNALSPNPFAAFYKLGDKYAMCASPERFLAKRGKKLISQPIKGTIGRGSNPDEDTRHKLHLRTDPKELQENVMVVDLVRNDLTHAARPGTVAVEELFGIYSFKQVHQMISTVVCQIADNVTDAQAIKNTFPMGSMTGAPKISAMQLMEKYERSKRGIYSGAIGYFSPDGDFDFNVVIRSMLYNAGNKYLSFHVGGAITYNADADREYEECLLKASAILEVLGISGKQHTVS